MLVSMVFQALYVLVDLFWVGRLGTDAVAAVGISADAAMQTLTEEYLLWFIPAMALQFAIVAMGSAVATFVAVAVGVIWISFYFVDRDAYLRFHCSDWKPEFRIRRGLPDRSVGVSSDRGAWLCRGAGRRPEFRGEARRPRPRSLQDGGVDRRGLHAAGRH